MADPVSNLSGEEEEIPSSAREVIRDLLQQNQALAAEINALRSELKQLKRSAVTWEWIFQPGIVLAASLGTALAFATFLIIDNDLSGNPGRHGFYLYYMVPLSAPFVAFLFDRAARLKTLHTGQWAVDLPVIVLGLIRAFTALPGISGHALFLTYALLTTRSRVAQILATIVLAQVIYLKVFTWHDATVWSGMLAAAAAAGVFWGIDKGRKGNNTPKFST